MNIIICLDDKNGLIFGTKRQSRDIKIYERILENTKGRKLLMNEYSYNLFKDLNTKINVRNDFLSLAKKKDYCFIENDEFLNYDKFIESITVYRWNTVYPSTVRIDEKYLNKRKKISVFEFCGNSHQLITEEVYV
ncbi:MAG: ribonuclease Z [Clostridia bacterium]|nr:ribonuclease Z [Clostridia bacterium]